MVNDKQFWETKSRKVKPNTKYELRLGWWSFGIGNILPSINKLCEKVFEQKIVVEAELDIDISCSSTVKTNEGWIKKEEEEETRKKSLIWHHLQVELRKNS